MKRAALMLLVACAGMPVIPTDAGTPDSGAARADAGESEIVAAHNAVRARAMPAPSPALPPMAWHEGAAATASAWVERCEFKHNTGITGTYGENIFAMYGSRPTPTQVVEDWASEAPNYDYANNRCSGGECGHYTQLVWRASVGVGCASKVCSENSPFGAGNTPWIFWVCDYAPPGNVIGQRPY